MSDPKLLTDDELKGSILWAMMPILPSSSDEQKRFNRACLDEYIHRDLRDFAIDDFIEFIGLNAYTNKKEQGK